MSVPRKISGSSNDTPPLRGSRRVRMSAAVSIVLLCWGLGFVLGVVYPPEVLVSQWRAPVVAPHYAPMKSVEHAGAPPPSTQRAPEGLVTAPVAPFADEAVAARAPAAATAASTEAHPVPPPEQQGSAAEPSSLVPARTSQTLTPDDIPHPDPVATAEATATEQVRDAAMLKAEDVEEEVMKAEPRVRERRKTSRRARSTRAARGRDRARVARPSDQPKGVISQIPIVGPVVGLIVPF